MKAGIFLAEGFEIAEALCPLDVLRRAGIETELIGVGGMVIKSSCGVAVSADIPIEEASGSYDLLFCPGGMPGAVNLSQSWDVNRMLCETVQHGIVSAICASPAVVLFPLGLLEGHEATCFPGSVSYAPSFSFSSEGVVESGNIITGKSAGWAFDLGLRLVARLKGEEAAAKVRSAIFYKL